MKIPALKLLGIGTTGSTQSWKWMKTLSIVFSGTYRTAFKLTGKLKKIIGSRITFLAA
jgi:hypothetical protein